MITQTYELLKKLMPNKIGLERKRPTRIDMLEFLKSGRGYVYSNQAAPCAPDCDSDPPGDC